MLLAVFVLVILMLTLVPTKHLPRTPGFFGCLICGERGLADTALNIVLFLPVGLLAALAFGPRRGIVLAGALFSAGIELAQISIPGRDASVGDLLFNTVGTLLGIYIVAQASSWLKPGRRALLTLAFGFAIAIPGLAAVTGWLVRPSLSSHPWYTMWNPDLDHLAEYRGAMVASRVGTIELIGTSRLPDVTRDAVRAALLRGDDIDVRVVVAERARRLAGMFAIYDEEQQEILLIGAQSDDLVLHYRLRAEDVRLDRPDLRLRDAFFGLQSGDTIAISATRTAGRHCLRAGLREACELGLDVPHSWRLLLNGGTLKDWFTRFVSLSWTFALAAPLGFYARSRATAALGGAAWMAAFVLIPGLDPWLLPTPPGALATAAASFVLFTALGVRQERARLNPPSREAVG